MQIEFRKTGTRRYAVKILRDGLPALEMNPAPGFDEMMPHDLCHLIVEQVLEIKNAIFGQIANNGNAGTFRNAPSESDNTKNDSRIRRKSAKKGKRMVKSHLEDYARSERATYVCWENWLSASSDAKLQRRAAEMRQNADGIYNQMSAAERAVYTTENLAKVRLKMDELSCRWQALKIGESMIIDWKI
jgi:hypothetical protein